MIVERHKKDELVILKILATLESESTAILTNLEISREMVKAALSELRESHPEQISLLNILNGTRFKYPYQGILLPTKCQNSTEGGECGREDSFEHMLTCYGLQRPPKGSPENIDFLVSMARGTMFPRLGGPKPMYLERLET